MIELTCTNGEKVLLPVSGLIVKSGNITTVMSGVSLFKVKESYDDIITSMVCAKELPGVYIPND